jgi:hypothetical protein
MNTSDLESHIPPKLLNPDAKQWLMLGLSLVLMSCAPAGGSFPVSKAPPPDRISIAVSQFKVSEKLKSSVTDQGVLSFEQLYWSNKLLEALGNHPACSGAHFATSPTSATDFTINGELIESNGRNLVIQLKATRNDDKVVMTRQFKCNHQDGRPTLVKAKINSFAAQIAADIVNVGRQTDINLPEARALAYLDEPGIPVSEQMILNAELAGEVERTQILTPITKELSTRMKIAEDLYVRWCSESIPLIIEREVARSEQSGAALGQGIAVLGFLGAATMAYEAGATGNQQQSQLAQMYGMETAQAFADAGAQSAVAKQKIKALDHALAAYKNEFNVGKPGLVTVRIYGQLLKLQGAQSQQVDQFRTVVKEKLRTDSVKHDPT